MLWVKIWRCSTVQHVAPQKPSLPHGVCCNHGSMLVLRTDRALAALLHCGSSCSAHGWTATRPPKGSNFGCYHLLPDDVTHHHTRRDMAS